jgi:hypothetical protein
MELKYIHFIFFRHKIYYGVKLKLSLYTSRKTRQGEIVAVFVLDPNTKRN